MQHIAFGRRAKPSQTAREYVKRERRATSADRRDGERRTMEVPVVLDRRVTGDRRRVQRRVVRKAGATVHPVAAANDQDIAVYRTDYNFGTPPHLKKKKDELLDAILDVIDLAEFGRLPKDEVRTEVINVIVEVLRSKNVLVSGNEQRQLVDMLVNEVVGFGPLEPLLADPSISDILVNGPDKVWVEIGGQLNLTDVKFDSNKHLMNVIQRIVTRVNRHIDESSPLVDARLPDGSRINVIIPPLAVQGPSVSIRKFVERETTLEQLAAKGTMSPDMAVLLKTIARCRLNVLISGGTGTGKTTMLNAMSHHISPRERIVTIEDTAELQLHQPNLVSLESRPANTEQRGLITIGDLLVNALRMRPDRILVGEVRGAEAAEMLQAMNTGHDGSIGTIHANTARDAVMRFENMICMNPKYTMGRVTRQQIMSALDIVVHLSRMHDGKRRVMSIAEVVGLEDDVVLMQDIYRFEATEEDEDGNIGGEFRPTGVRPHFYDRIRHFKLDSDEQRTLDYIRRAA
ncbi:MAG: CpaF family protein [Alphaproteobacteria bacterium]